MTDDLLAQHFSNVRHPLDDSDWLAVRRRARRPRRRVALIALVAAAAALLVAPAFGLGDRVLELIQGPTAPPEVQKSFTEGDSAREQHFAYAAAAGAEMHDRFSHVVPGAARQVAALETGDGPIYLWATPTEDGRQCWLIQSGGDPATGRPYGFGSCDGIDRTGSIQPDGPAWTIERPSVRIMHVRTYDDSITRVDLDLEGAPDMSLPVSSGHALGTIPNEEGQVRPLSVVGRNADGEVIARWTAPER
jgi:hypothetical protein